MVSADADFAENVLADVSGVIEHLFVNVRPEDGRERDALKLVNESSRHSHSSISITTMRDSRTRYPRRHPSNVIDTGVCL